MYKDFGISEKLIELKNKCELELRSTFEELDVINEFNQLKILKAMQKARLSDQHFNWTTGYGYNDIGREKVEEIYAEIFNTEDALVRPQIVSGTHALSLALWGVLRPGDTMLSISGKPYDTLEEVIGLNGNNGSSLIEFGIKYSQIDLTSEGYFDYIQIENHIKSNRIKMLYIQRSGGYSFRPSLSIDAIEKINSIVKSINPSIIIMVDNCYGEFIDMKEPTEVGADLMAGSLIKNPGGGIALTGGYIVGNKDLITQVSYRLTSPGIGKETGLTFGQTRQVLQGLFMAPKVVNGALKGAMLCGEMGLSLGFEVSPQKHDKRSDIIQAVKLGSPEKVIQFCQGIQATAPVDSYVTPEPWEMPGYHSPVIMAAGAFVQGSSIELSADAPIEEPFVVYFQGGLTYEHSKLGVLMGYNRIL
ncbi:MAG: methionine gamma-lyase family protein [Clostridiales bacterium]|nr:methionine gamma-lyase family protein [Clostridiales bacterium]